VPEVFFISPLQTRVLQPELMDDPDLDPRLHRQALHALRRVNAVSRTSVRIWGAVRELARESGRPLRVLDVGCGGGDALIDLGRRARRAGVGVELHGLDMSGTALREARERAEGAGLTLGLHRVDVLEGEIPAGFDLVTSTLFLHHLETEEAVALLARLGAASRAGLVQDLLRTRLGYALAWTGLRLLSRSPVAHVDGPRSVEAGFTMAEADGLARGAGLTRHRVRRAWPERFVLSWGGVR
jgi:SAM-dependent methyltransferase